MSKNKRVQLMSIGRITLDDADGQPYQVPPNTAFFANSQEQADELVNDLEIARPFDEIEQRLLNDAGKGGDSSKSDEELQEEELKGLRAELRQKGIKGWTKAMDADELRALIAANAEGDGNKDPL